MLSTKLALLGMARRQSLSPATYDELNSIAASKDSMRLPDDVLRRGVHFLALGLAGLGVIFFIAANWKSQDPLVTFVVLEALVGAACYGAGQLVRFRSGFALFGLLAIGALLGFFGQHYQTGADPWQLFALWSVLAFPLAFASRSDLVWAAWVIVAMCGISTWLGIYNPGRWRGGEPLHASAVALVVPLALSKRWRIFTGAGAWSQNLALLSATSMVTVSGVVGVFDSGIGFGLALCAIGAVFVFFMTYSAFDTVALSIAALAIDILLACASVRLGFEFKSVSALLIIVGFTTVSILALSGMVIVQLYRNQAHQGQVRDQPK